MNSERKVSINELNNQIIQPDTTYINDDTNSSKIEDLPSENILIPEATSSPLL